MIGANDKSAVYNLLRLAREQRNAIHELRLLVGALAWMVTKGDPAAMREVNEMIWRIEQGRPQADAERDLQWQSWLLSVQHEVEQDRPEIRS